MTIHMELSTESINHAIEQLEIFKTEMELDLQHTVEILTEVGAMVAQGAYGDWGVAAVPSTEEHHGYIDVMGDMPLIAEFGAGDTTLNPATMFENSPDTDVYPGSYSLEYGTKEYATYGSWHFGGEKYTHVDPHMGLYSAKNYIIENSTRIAQEVFGS